ncbi:hypothetical protein ACSAZK_00505 [Methanosarcina sp. Mfa9]|uniref:hypothetical protein n=1 Tax=Methanosarcina sp. Mfa9 TaxID=3439063 RepID=UPI003F8499BA
MARKSQEVPENPFPGPGLKLNIGNLLDLNLHLPDSGPGYRSRKGNWKTRLKRTNPGFQTISPNVYRLAEGSNKSPNNEKPNFKSRANKRIGNNASTGKSPGKKCGDNPETTYHPSVKNSGYLKAGGRFLNVRGKSAQKTELEKCVEKPEHDKHIQIPEFYEIGQDSCKAGKYMQDREYGNCTQDSGPYDACPKPDDIQKGNSGPGQKQEDRGLSQDPEPVEHGLGVEPVKSKSLPSKKAAGGRIPERDKDFRDFDKRISRWKEGQKKIRLQKVQKKYRLRKEQKKRRLQKDSSSEGLKSVNLKTELEKGNPEYITEVFETENKVIFLTEVPANYKKEDIHLRYYFKKGDGHLIIYAGPYQRHILVNRKVALKLKGTVPEFVSLMNGVLTVDMDKY